MNEHEDLISRLRTFGRRPVDTDLAERHLAALDGAGGAGRPARVRPHRLKVVAAFAVGLMAGTTGLATAGALPDSAQEIAHRALGSVGVNVPHGDRYQGPECGGEFGNHGQYVRSQPKENRAAAAASRCGKPIQAGAGDDSGDGPGGAPGKASGCQGPPPWAGKGKPDQAAKDARRQACGADQDAGDQDAGEDAPAPAVEAVEGEEGGEPTSETTSTSAPTTTTTTTTTTDDTTPDTTDDTTTTTTDDTTTSTGGDTTTTTTSLDPVPGLGT